MADIRTCLVCGAKFECKHKSRAGKYCSNKCNGIAARTATANVTCTECGKPFHSKPSKIKNARKLGIFCSVICAASAKSKAYSSDGNPNFRNRIKDSDGYLVIPPRISEYLGFGNKRIHQAVCCSLLGVKKLPRTLHVHHRDCDMLNNKPENLAILNASEHKWLHRQFGSAALWAMCNGHISAELLASWADDKEKAWRLLTLTVLTKCASEYERKLIEKHYENQDQSIQ